MGKKSIAAEPERNKDPEIQTIRTVEDTPDDGVNAKYIEFIFTRKKPKIWKNMPEMAERRQKHG